MPNVGQQIEQDRRLATGRGDRLNVDAEGRANTARQTRAATRAYSDSVYDPLIGGRGGYTPQEQEAIYGNPDRYTATDADFEQNYLTPDEYNGSMGSPWERGAYFDADSDMARAYESSGRVTGAADEMGENLDSAIGPDLGLDAGYQRDQMGNITGTASRVRGAFDPTKLRASDTALTDIRMSPEEYQRTVLGAGLDVGAQYGAASDDLTRRAQAAGMNPMGIGAQKERLLRRSAVEGANAMTRAKIEAGDAKARRAGVAEDYRMRGEESAADRVGGAELNAGRFEVGARSDLEGMRLDATRDVSGRRMRAAEATGVAKIGAQVGNANRELGARQFNTTTGTAIATGVEQDSAARAAAAAANRQTTSQNNQANRFAQGFANTGQQGQAAQTVGGARRSDAAEGRAYLQTQQQGDRSDEQADYNRQLGIYGEQNQAQQAATATQNAQIPLWQRIAGTIVGGAQAAGSIATGMRRPGPG